MKCCENNTRIFTNFYLFTRYGGEYHPDGRQFIVVCGNINYESVQTFLVRHGSLALAMTLDVNLLGSVALSLLM